MEEQREESEFLGDLDVDDANTESVVSDENLNREVDDGNTANSDSDEKLKADVGNLEDVVGSLSGEEKTLSSHDVDAITDGAREEEETITSAGNVENAICEVEDNGAAPDAVEQHAEIFEKPQQSAADVAEDQADPSAKKSEEDSDIMDVDSTLANEENSVGLYQQANPGSEIKVAYPEESTQLTEEENSATVAAEICRDEEITILNQKEENGEAMEIDYAAEDQDLDNAANESDDADRNDSSDEHKEDNAATASDLNGTIKSADLANPNIPTTEDAAPGEVEPLDHNGLFDPSSDITNFIDFSGVSSWSGNIQDLKTDTRVVSLKEDTKATDMAEEIAKVGIENESNEALVAFGSESPVATECSKEDQEGKDLECLDKETADEQDTMRVEEDITHEAPNIDPNEKEDTEMGEDPNNSDYADEEAGSDIKTNGVKRKADVLSEDLPGEGRKTVSLAKVSFTQRPSFKIGECIARAASQMAGSPSVLKGSNFGDDETLSTESFVSQLHCAATDPSKENVVSDIAVGFFLNHRNSISQKITPEKVSSSKRVKVSNSNAGGTEAFEFEEMGDTYWTDRVIHNGGEEQQTPPIAKEDYQIVPVELKPAQVQRTRRPYRRRQSQISDPHSASVKPADFDENAPAELIMNFSETDTIPPEKSLSKMFRHFGPIQEPQTEVDKEKNRARVVFKKGADAEVAYNSAGRFNIFGEKTVKYELSHTITETFKVQPYVVSLGGQEDAALCLPS